jgi:hypothetical protein
LTVCAEEKKAEQHCEEALKDGNMQSCPKSKTLFRAKGSVAGNINHTNADGS